MSHKESFASACSRVLAKEKRRKRAPKGDETFDQACARILSDKPTHVGGIRLSKFKKPRPGSGAWWEQFR